MVHIARDQVAQASPQSPARGPTELCFLASTPIGQVTLLATALHRVTAGIACSFRINSAASSVLYRDLVPDPSRPRLAVLQNGVDLNGAHFSRARARGAPTQRRRSAERPPNRPTRWPFLFSKFRFGATMELGRSPGTIMRPVDLNGAPALTFLITPTRARARRSSAAKNLRARFSPLGPRGLNRNFRPGRHDGAVEGRAGEQVRPRLRYHRSRAYPRVATLPRLTPSFVCRLVCPLLASLCLSNLSFETWSVQNDRVAFS
jgi:hypothetical protein